MFFPGAGLDHVGIEPVGGFLSDHYDPRAKVLRLSPEVYSGHTLAAVGVAAHEAGHAIQDAVGYAPLAIRNAAVPAANFGSSVGWLLILIGLFIHQMVVWIGIAFFACVVFFQLVNLPVEFNASARARERLLSLGIISPAEEPYVQAVLGAAAWTYVAATLQAVMQLAYFIFRFGRGHDE